MTILSPFLSELPEFPKAEPEALAAALKNYRPILAVAVHAAAENFVIFEDRRMNRVKAIRYYGAMELLEAILKAIDHGEAPSAVEANVHPAPQAECRSSTQ